jgi:hypothetical protein
MYLEDNVSKINTDSDYMHVWEAKGLPSTVGVAVAGSAFSLRLALRTASKQLVTGSLQFPHSLPGRKNWIISQLN